MMVLKIKWHRLIADEGGQTCPRCGSTEKELEKAAHTLNQSLAPLGIEVVLEKKALDPATFARDVLESNRIWIDDKPIEELLGAEVGQSRCCDVCGDAECRTLEIEKNTYETIPSDVIIKAGLIAASKMIAAEPIETCCEDNTSKKIPSSTCCS